jgi:hypothetical protein
LELLLFDELLDELLDELVDELLDELLDELPPPWTFFISSGFSLRMVLTFQCGDDQESPWRAEPDDRPAKGGRRAVALTPSKPS